MKKIINILLCSILYVAMCSNLAFEVRAEEQTGLEYQHTIDDYIIIPDKYNTGVPAGTELIPFTEETVVEGTVLSDDGGSAPVITYMADRDYDVINQLKNKTLASETMIEGYDFSSKKIITTNTKNFTEKKTIIFKNCKFNEFQHNDIPIGNLYFVFENCTFIGDVSYSNITLNKCYITTKSTDGINALANYFVNDSFIANLLSEPSQTGLHVDGVQIYGYEGVDAENIHFNNVRFALPDFYYDGTATTGTNAAIMLSMRYSDCDNISFKNITIDMGGHWYPIYNDDMEQWVETNITFKDIRVSDTYDKIFYSKYNEEAVVENVNLNSKLYVSSVWKDSNNKTHIVCTNHTKTDKTLKVMTDLGEYSFDIEASPTQKELFEDAYLSYTYDNMPYDKEFVINEDVQYVVCYDTESLTENQIRYVNYNETELPELPQNPESPETSVSDGNIMFKANVESWFEVALPDSYNIDKLESSMEFSVSGDIAGDKVLSVTSDETFELKNSVDEILSVQTSITKDKFTYLDLKNTANSNFTLAIEKLPAGRYIGQMPIYIAIIDAD